MTGRMLSALPMRKWRPPVHAAPARARLSARRLASVSTAWRFTFLGMSSNEEPEAGAIDTARFGEVSR